MSERSSRNRSGPTWPERPLARAHSPRRESRPVANEARPGQAESQQPSVEHAERQPQQRTERGATATAAWPPAPAADRRPQPAPPRDEDSFDWF